MNKMRSVLLITTIFEFYRFVLFVVVVCFVFYDDDDDEDEDNCYFLFTF